jgi:hypothetical protein
VGLRVDLDDSHTIDAVGHVLQQDAGGPARRAECTGEVQERGLFAQGSTQVVSGEDVGA